MSPSPQLAPPGSSSYDSTTLHVGDGTWDAGRDTFLLPNLMGVNFATMMYNGMGNRFLTMDGYHSLIRAHGVIAAITFLGLIPASVFLARFFGRQRALAIRLHIWLQILSLLLVTVVFILGFMAVGPNRSLTNPHHGIGVAIYVLFWVQVMGGCLVHRHNKKNRSIHLPLRAMLHHWVGRAIALLGITQVALGLTLYGSPLYLFILFTVYVFVLMVLYFILEWLHERRKSRADYDSGGSYYSEEEVVQKPKRESGLGGLGKLAVIGAAGLGLAALFRRREPRNRPHDDVVGTESGTSYYSDEKYSEADRPGWGTRLLEIGAVGGGLFGLKKLWDRRRRDDDDISEAGPYRPPLGGNQSVTDESVSRIEEGVPPRPVTPLNNSPGYIRPTHPLSQPPMNAGSGRRESGSSYEYDSYLSGSPSRVDRRSHTLRNALATGGALFAVRQLFKNRKQRREDQRAEELRKQRVEEERIARMNSVHRYTGDGTTPPRRVRPGAHGSQTASDVTSVFSEHQIRPGTGSVLPVAGAAAVASGALADRDRIRPGGTDVPVYPPVPPSTLPTDVPPVPPIHRSEYDSSGSEVYTTASGRNRHRHHLRDEAAAGLAGAAVGAMATDAMRRRQDGRNTDSVESPPVSLKVKMHNDGRHVTLRRLTEEEAAAQRDARRRENRASGSRRRRNSSFSSSDGGDALGAGPSGDRRWRRTEAIEARQEAERLAAGANPPVIPTGTAYTASPPPVSSQAIDPLTGQPYLVPPPPPIPGSTSNLGPAGSITSPGTETSGATEYANNRRRRRAERAAARLARDGRAQNTVDFT